MTPDSTGLHPPSTEADTESASTLHRGTQEVDTEADSPDDDVGLTIAQAAALLGVHPNTLRKRIRKGTLPALMVDGPTGREYRIPASAVAAPSTESHTETPPAPPPRQTDPSTESGLEADSQVDTGDNTEVGTTLQTFARAREMALYTEQLLAPYVRRLEEQAEEIGRLRAELRQAQARVAEAETVAAAVAELVAEELPAVTSPEIHQASQAGPRDAEVAQEPAARERRPWWRIW